MDISDAPPLDWRVLNDQTQIAIKDGRVVAIAYTVETRWDRACKATEWDYAIRNDS
jgi:hypothetical protein